MAANGLIGINSNVRRINHPVPLRPVSERLDACRRAIEGTGQNRVILPADGSNELPSLLTFAPINGTPHAHARRSVLAFFPKTPLCVTLHSPGAQTMDGLIVQPLGMATRHAQQPGHRGFCDLGQARGGSDAPAFIQMVADIFGFCFRYLGVEEGRAAAFGTLFATGTTAQQAHAIVALHVTHNEVVLAALTKLLAFCIDTGYSGEVRSFQAVLLSGVTYRQGGLHPT